MGMGTQFVIPVLVSILILSISFPINDAQALTDFLFKFGSFGTGDGEFLQLTGLEIST